MRMPNASTRNFKRLREFPRFLLALLSLVTCASDDDHEIL